MAINCDSCPQEVINVVVNQVADILQRVQEIEQLTKNFNTAFLQMLVNRVTDDLQAWVNAIPTPPLLDPASLLAYLTCPLTPFLFNLDVTVNSDGKYIAARVYLPPSTIAQLSPSQLYYIFTQQYNQTVINVNAAYIRSTQKLSSAFLVQFMQFYLHEIQAAMGDPFQFTSNLAIAQGTVAYVARVCPALYNNPAYPFLAFTETMTDFVFDGFLPNGIDPSVQQVLDLVVEAENKILAWKTLLTIPV